MGQVVILGGGAAGLTAAISAAQEGADVKIFEMSARVGQKILATGNGRCNLTNMQLGPADYNAPEFVAPTLDAWGPERMRAWFEHFGLLTVEEREGRVYPLSNMANSVLDVLRLACQRLGVRTIINSKVSNVDGVKADAVVVASGGGSTLLESAGHTLVPFTPVLCSLKTDIEPIRGLSGVRANAEVSVLAEGDPASVRARERGEVQFKDYGVSGIVIFNLSRVAQEGDVLVIDLLPDMTEDEVVRLLEERAKAFASDTSQGTPPTHEELLCGMFHSRVNMCVLREAQVKSTARADEDGMRKIAHVCKNIRLRVKGPGDVKHAQVTRGGAALDEFDAATLESKLHSKVFAAGEALDIDGRCGGYNLHWAWASGIVAGASAARSL